MAKPHKQQRAAQAASYHQMDAQAVLRILEADAAAGLSTAEAARRLERFGRNRIRSTQGQSALRRFLSQFRQPLVYKRSGLSEASGAHDVRYEKRSVRAQDTRHLGGCA